MQLTVIGSVDPPRTRDAHNLPGKGGYLTTTIGSVGQGALAGEAPAPPPKKLDAIRIVTRCTDIEQFTTMFRRFCNPTSCFIPSLTTRPVGMETAFSIRLVDQTPVLRGVGVVLDAWSDGENPFGRPGIHLGIRRLAAESVPVFQQLLIPRMARGARTSDTIPNELKAKPQPPTDEVAAQPVPEPEAEAKEQRTPGADMILPANPLMEMNDDSLGAFVDCQLQEIEGEESRPMTAGDLDFEGPLTLPNNPVIALAAAAAKAVVQRPAMRTTLGVAPLAAPKVYAAPELVVTELVDRVESTSLPAMQSPIVAFLSRWWVACAVALGLIVLVAIMAMTSSSPEPPPLVPAPKPKQSAITPPPRSPELASTQPTENQPESKAVVAGPCQLTVTTKPEGAYVKIDSEPVGEAPVTVSGPCARRRIEADAPRWAAESKWVVVEATSSFEVVLARPRHQIRVMSTPSDSTVLVNGSKAGTTPTTVDIPGWTYVTIEIERAGYVTAKRKHKSSKVKGDEFYAKLDKK